MRLPRRSNTWFDPHRNPYVGYENQVWVNGQLTHTFRYTDSGQWTEQFGERIFRYTELWENETRYQETFLAIAGSCLAPLPAAPRLLVSSACFCSHRYDGIEHLSEHGFAMPQAGRAGARSARPKRGRRA